MKGQSSIEFLALFTILVLFSGVILYINFLRSVRTGELKKSFDAEKLSDVVVIEIAIALEKGDGYSHTFLLPATDYPYNMSIHRDGYLDISWRGGYLTTNIPARNITNGVSTDFQMSMGLNKITNSGGTILIGSG